MKRFIIPFLTIVFISEILYSQETEFNFINIFQDKVYRGSIGNYPITMTLYNNENKIFGSYYYERVKIPIKLTGKIISKNNSSILSVNDSIYLKEYDNDTVKASITASIDENILIGTWKNIETNKKLPINLKRIENQAKYFNDKYPLIETINSRLIECDFSDYFDFKPTVNEFVEIKDKKEIYYLLLVSYPSRGEYSDTQYCGAGEEEFLIFVGFNEKHTIIISQIFKIISCISDINFQCNEEYIDCLFSFKESKILDFEKLKIVISDLENKKTYELDTNNLALGFVHINTEKR